MKCLSNNSFKRLAQIIKKYSKKVTEEDIKSANLAGLRHKDSETTYWSYYTPLLQVSYDYGHNGIDLTEEPVVTGFRYGDPSDSGLSYNYRDQVSERGLSLANLEGEDEVGSSMFFKDRGLVQVSGVLLPKTGSDGEPLILPINIVEMQD